MFSFSCVRQEVQEWCIIRYHQPTDIRTANIGQTNVAVVGIYTSVKVECMKCFFIYLVDGGEGGITIPFNFSYVLSSSPCWDSLVMALTTLLIVVFLVFS